MTNIKNVYADEIVETEIVVSKINNYEILSQMTLFPNHDNMNGCGMVAMSILLKFYKGTCQVVPFLMCKREKTQNFFLFAY